jgi:glycosyltransferase involved in cell wall biosynthesis
MRVALVAPSFVPRPGGLERHVGELARGLFRRGAQVEVLTQDASRRLPRVSDFEGVTVRRFMLPLGVGRGAVAPALWQHLRRSARAYDVAHVHARQATFAAAVMRAGLRRVVFTPHAPVQLLARWPYMRVTRSVVEQAALTLCTSSVESDLLSGRFPRASERIREMAGGVDGEAIAAAHPFPHPGTVVLAAGRLDRYKRVDRAIAAMASLGDSYRLVVVGDGPAARRLAAHAEDLRVSSHVDLVGLVSDGELYRWLRTARVAVALAEHGASGLGVTEALSAGVPVVASDIPVHREAAKGTVGAGVIFVSAEGSPLEVADAISGAVQLSCAPASPGSIPSWDQVADATVALYRGESRGAQRFRRMPAPSPDAVAPR